jgi:superfamily II DNA or RNA helicase
MKQSSERYFFAAVIRRHRFLGRMFSAHLMETKTKIGRLAASGRISPDNAGRFAHTFSEAEKEIVQTIDKYSDDQLFALFKRRVRSLPEFFKLVETSREVETALRDYIEQMMFQVFKLVAQNGIPVYVKEENFDYIPIDRRLEAVPDAADPVFNFELSDQELRYRLTASCGEEKAPFHFLDSDIICMDPCLVCVGKKLYHFASIDGKKIAPFLTKPFIVIPKASVRKYMETFVLTAIYSHQVNAQGFGIREVQAGRRILLSPGECITGGWVLFLRFGYGDGEYLYGSGERLQVRMDETSDGYCFYRFERDLPWEDKQLAILTKVGLTNPSGDAAFVPDTGVFSRIDHLVRWLSENREALKAQNIHIKQDSDQASYYLDRSSIEVFGDQREDWFDIHGKVTLEGYEIPFLWLKPYILRGIREFKLPDNRIFLIPEEWFTLYKSLFLFGNEAGNKLEIPRVLFNLLVDAEVKAPTADELRRRFAESGGPDEFILPAGLKATLRNYQKEGLLWLKLLDKNRMGGCLADDMGLGKTLQALAFFQSLKEENVNRTMLIIVPTSLVHNWAREIERFTTGMKTCIHTGAQRTRELDALMHYDLIISTYGTVRNDIDWMKDASFHYVVLDESQVIKNPDSKSYQAVIQLKAHGFLALSGTPIENSLMDLWAQMNILNRGLLGNRKSFREEFVTSIEKGNDTQKRDLLKKWIEPFLLRRKKEDVAKDLPDITRQIVYCEMTDSQAQLYESEKNTIRTAILKNIAEQGFERSTISILHGLTRLRQLANHPAMIYKRKGLDSGKFEEVTRSLENVVAEGHKALVFSSFVKHLHLVAGYLDENHVKYVMLTGTTRNRQEVIHRFQNEEDLSVFLISIKAGGVGLNLTAADYIFILDPWWNPAVEGQAVSRAHRIGQDKNVFVYRFISVDTLEEKIIRLQERKESLAKDFVESADPLQLLGEQNVIDLLR